MLFIRWNVKFIQYIYKIYSEMAIMYLVYRLVHSTVLKLKGRVTKLCPSFLAICISVKQEVSKSTNVINALMFLGCIRQLFPGCPPYTTGVGLHKNH